MSYAFRVKKLLLADASAQNAFDTPRGTKRWSDTVDNYFKPAYSTDEL